MAERKRQSALAGQSRRALSLGIKDPRLFRGAQGLAGGRHYVGWGLAIDNFGQLFVVSAMLCRACDGGDPGPGGPGSVYDDGGVSGGVEGRNDPGPDYTGTARGWLGL